MLDRKTFTVKVEEFLNKYVQQKISDAELVGDGYVRMWKEINQYVANGGKRIRPYLAYLVYSAYGGTEDDVILPTAASLELMHACLLVHDDIIDRDFMRHGKPNIAGSYRNLYKQTIEDDAAHYANSAALLAGDLLLAASYDVVNSSNLTSDTKVMVHSLLQNALFATAGGQLLDVESVLFPLQVSSPEAVAEYKTAIYSFQLPMLCGAKVAGASDDDIAKLVQLGLEVGVAFQLRDDLLGVFGAEGQTGKSNRSDIYEKKRTMLIKLTHKGVNTKESERLESLFNKDGELSDGEVDEVFEMISGTDTKSVTELQIADRSKKAKSIIESLSISVEYKQALENLVDKLSKRSA